MNIFHNLLLLQIFLMIITLITAQWCISFNSVVKTRMQWNNGQRLVSHRNFFGVTTYKYEPYVYSVVQNYHDYERINVCCDGYTKISDTRCEPVCNPSCPANTHCIRPDICECDMGYRGYTASVSDIQCEAFCRPACSPNAQCVQPNECSCISGYTDIDGSGKCQPVCEKECPENASCTKPNQCTCRAGYLDSGLGQCRPVCSQTCPDHSDCTKPDTCTCHQNFSQVDGKCVAICEGECPQHAECVKPNECHCIKGYETAQKLNNTSLTCVANCDRGCPPFAKCTQPNICECEVGYVKTDKNLCEPVCNNECPKHSNCTAPNTCTCHKGYNMLEQQCQPICEKPCPDHSSCSEPNKCVCESGYQLKLSSIYNLYCEPVCQRNCSSFGKCVQPNKCECLKGYEMDELEICQPVCTSGCRNGFCFQPEVCICNPGYLMGPQKECEPACSMACQNGSCVEPEICQCHKGFKLQGNSINICEPVCQPECINGICAGPNVCICNENYVPLANAAGGLNHSHCQLMPTTSLIPKLKNEETTTDLAMVEVNDKTTRTITSLQPDKLREGSLVSADVCNEQCQCWQEFDDFGTLTSNQCAHLCIDAFNNACLDLKLCQCDAVKNQLICRTTDDATLTDDLVYLMCKLSRLKATSVNSLDKSISSDIKRAKTTQYSKFRWWWFVVLGAIVVMCLMGIVVYLRFRKVQDPIIDFEL